MNNTYRIPETMVEDTRAFRLQVERFLSGTTSADDFKALRVPMGIYEQRESDTYMVRVRGAGGVFLPSQARLIAGLAEEFGNGIVHATTRQNLQIHRVLIQDTPVIIERLLDRGLTVRGGGGNTVRNVSACPSAGICRKEAFDVTPYALALTEYLIADRGNFKLPRKFKPAFSGCGNGCALSSIADLGFFAHMSNGVRGFSVYAGGGMGARSAVGVLIEDFIPAESIFEVAEAVKRLFDKYGDRTNRSKARLRFVVERFGAEEFRRLYGEELERVHREGIWFPEIRVGEDSALTSQRTPHLTDRTYSTYRTWVSNQVSTQKQPHLYTIHIPLRRGEILSSTLRLIADMASVFTGVLRTTQSQDLQLRDVPESSLHSLFDALAEGDTALLAAPSVRCISCTGATTCRLGVCNSTGLGAAIESATNDMHLPFQAEIKISGCPNSCGHHPIAVLGLSGGLARSNGRSYPRYTIYAGGRVSEGDTALSESLGKVPARTIPGLMREFFVAADEECRSGESFGDLMDRLGYDYLRGLAQKYAEPPPYDSSPEFYEDFP